MKLEEEFNIEMLSLYKKTKIETGYNAAYFLKLITDYGGLNAAKKLLIMGDPAEGFLKLWEIKRLDLSLEVLILTSPWDSLFDATEIACAKKRLEKYGFKKINDL